MTQDSIAAPISKVKLAHISDLHFSEHADASSPHAIHSSDQLIGLTKKADLIRACNRVLVSGDLSDRGNTDALLQAHNFLFSEYSIGRDQTVGLRLNRKTVGVVPGNHDAFNTQKNGDALTRWQRSLENFNKVFPEHEKRRFGCHYDWIQCGDWGVYLAYADTCFLGDPASEERERSGTPFDKIAKGKLARDQAKQLLDWSDLGRMGKLLRPESTDAIPGNLFSRAFKVLVMHHYVFEPAERKSEYLMSLCSKHDVFRNIALADFDVLLCGHKHVPDFGAHTYGYHLERRGKFRYLMNYFRRTVGLGSLPMQLVETSGKQWSKNVSAYLQGLFGKIRAENHDEELALLTTTLKDALGKPDEFRDGLRSLFTQFPWKSEQPVVTPSEMEVVQDHLSKTLSSAERKKLSVLCENLDRYILALKQRPFVQVMAGSAAKKTTKGKSPRTFNIHSISRDADGYQFTSERFRWNDETKEFSDSFQDGSMHFSDSKR